MISPEHRQKISEAKLKSDEARGPNAYQWNPDHAEQLMKHNRSRACYGFVGKMLGWVEGGYRDLDEIVPGLGYTCRQLSERLEAQFKDGMNWENYGRFGWHIDHIRPINSFPMGTPMSVINALDNLQPMWARDNLSKGKKWAPTSDRPSLLTE